MKLHTLWNRRELHKSVGSTFWHYHQSTILHFEMLTGIHRPIFSDEAGKSIFGIKIIIFKPQALKQKRKPVSFLRIIYLGQGFLCTLGEMWETYLTHESV